MDDNVNYDDELEELYLLHNNNTAAFLRFVKELEEGDNSGDSVQWYNLDKLRKDGDYIYYA